MWAALCFETEEQPHTTLEREDCSFFKNINLAPWDVGARAKERVMATNSKNGFSLLPQYGGVLDYLRSHPGSQAQMIADATDATLRTTRMRLLRMQAEGIVRSERYPRAILFYLIS